MGARLSYPEVDQSSGVAVVTGGNTGIRYKTAMLRVYIHIPNLPLNHNCYMSFCLSMLCSSYPPDSPHNMTMHGIAAYVQCHGLRLKSCVLLTYTFGQLSIL